MRILLMVAPTGMKQHSVHAGANYPLALCQLAATLDSSHNVRGYDPDVDPQYPHSLKELLLDFQPDLVGIGFRIFDTTLSYEPRSYLPELEAALRLIRRTVPPIHIALGGSGFSFFAHPLMRRLGEVDIGFYLGSEKAFPAFVNDPESRSTIPGILYREGGQVVFTGPPETGPLDDLPIPRFDLFPVSDYIKEDPTAIGIESKRGCKMQCVPCVYPFLMGDSYRLKSAARVVQEVKQLVQREVPSFFFLDSIFNLPHSHAQGVCQALVEAQLPITWGAFINAARFTEEQADLFHRAGCRRYYFSFDGVSAGAMKKWRRPVSWQQQRRAIALVKQRPDNFVHVSFLFGSPGETTRDLLAFPELLAFLARHRVFSMSVSFARIYPQTKLHEIAVQEGVISPEDDLLKPVFYQPRPSRAMRYLFHPLFQTVHGASRLRRRFRELLVQ
jgi:anaerobic magnesium-protoporphyrin IX monomethyl ester cyclase